MLGECSQQSCLLFQEGLERTREGILFCFQNLRDLSIFIDTRGEGNSVEGWMEDKEMDGL